MKKKTIITLFSLVGTLLLLSGGGYYYYTTTPTYALNQLKTAIETHDITSFEKYVDMAGSTNTVIDKILEKAYENINEPNSSGEAAGQAIGKGLVELFRPRLEELVTRQIKSYIETGSLDGNHDQKIAGLEKFLNKKDSLSFKGISDVIKDGKVATVKLEINQFRFDTTLTIAIKMRDKGSYWQVFDYSDIVNYGLTVDQLEKKRIDKLNAVTMDEVTKIIPVEKVEYFSTPQRFGSYLTYYVHKFEVTFKNKSGKAIKNFLASYTVFDKDFRHIVKVDYFNEPITVNGNLVREFSQDYQSKRLPDQLELHVELNQVEVTYEDGTQLKWHTAWEEIE